MPASVKFVGMLLGAGVVAALASGIVQHRQQAAQTRGVAQAITHGNVDAGKAAIARYACGACHIIPGIPSGTGRVGPSLRGMSKRAMIAGKFANAPDDMIRWIRQPQEMVPGIAMPDQPVTEQEARDIAAYLYTLR